MATDLLTHDPDYVIERHDYDMTLRVKRRGIGEIACVTIQEVARFPRHLSIEARIAMALACRRAGGLTITKQVAATHG
jgi:hypothetical protein